MISIVNIISSIKEAKNRLTLKYQRLGKDDVQESFCASPHGIDSNPPKKKVAVYCKTGDMSSQVLLGYIDENSKSLPGELRIYSTDENGSEKNYIYLKQNGDIEIGGDDDNMVRYSALNTSLQSQVNSINTELNKIAIAINGIVPGAYVPIPISLNLTSARIDQIKTSQ